MRFRHLFFLVVSSVLLSTLSLTAQGRQAVTKTKVQQLVEKKAEYHRLTKGVRDGYRIKIHFGVEREAAREVRTKFTTDFPENQNRHLTTYEEYQQPNFVVLVGDFATKLAAFRALKEIQSSFPNAFIVKGKINPR